MRKRLWLGSLVILGALLVAAWEGKRALLARELRATLGEAKKEISAGHYGRARKRLTEINRAGDDSGEVDYNLGICELYLGHAAQALEAWQRVPASGPFGHRAALQRAMLAMSLGQLSQSEEIFRKALEGDAGGDTPELLHGLQLLYHIEGRIDDVRAAIIDSWTWSDKPAEVIKQLFRLDVAPLPLETTRRSVEKGLSDDRVWLAQANLAIRTGQLEKAGEWLASCLKKRPTDPVIWRAILELARASGDTAEAWRAMEQLPADALLASEILRLRAWIAGISGDRVAERAELETLIAVEPSDISALDRLAALAGDTTPKDDARSRVAEPPGEPRSDQARPERGRPVDLQGDFVARLRAQKSAMMEAIERYRSLLHGDSIGDPGELAKLAKLLGRRIEANGWSLIRDHKVGAPGASRPALVPPELIATKDAQSRWRTLADRCADLRRKPSSVAADEAHLAVPRFSDRAELAGLGFVHVNGQTSFKRLPETMSGGVGLFDYDGDGWLDLYVVQGGEFPPPANAMSADRLYRNRRDGTFEDVTERAGLNKLPGGYGHGVAVGDFDNDGRADLFVTRWRSYSLLRNRGDGVFEDVTAKADLAGDRDWPTSAAWADLDSDGDLDLYVCHYLHYDVDTAKACGDAKTEANHYCSPRNFAALKDHVFRNDGGRFVDVTTAAGFVDPDGRGLGVVAADLDDDNRIDLYVANDMSANYLFRNGGGFHFDETAFHAGAAANSSGRFQSGMGIAIGDCNGDGRPDLAVTNYYGESTTLFHNLGAGMFADYTATSGLGPATRSLLGFGIALFDANNDGRLDLISANGHVSDYRPVFPWTMPIQLLLAGAGGRFQDVSARAGDVFQALHLGRGLAVGDMDNDGLVDAIVQSQNEPLAYLHNQAGVHGHWLTLGLVGVRSNRDGVGARVALKAGDAWQTRQRFGGGSYQSSGDPRIHFGLGEANRVSQLEVRWPSGQIDRYDNLEVDRGYLLREEATAAAPLPGWDRNPK
jgi:tetratricopeptide (TPR) repeat protein